MPTNQIYFCETFIVNSKQRLNGTHSNFSYKIQLMNKQFYDRVSVLQASVPKSMYMLPLDSYFTVDETLEVGGTLRQIQLSKGNYTRLSLQNILTSRLNTGQPSGVTYTVVYSGGSTSSNADTGKYTFSVSGNISTISFIFGTGPDVELLGFEKSTTYPFTANSLTCPNMINLNTEQTIFIRSNLVVSQGGILQELYASQTAFQSSIVYQTTDYHITSKQLSQNDIKNNDTYRFSITDENGVIIDLNGINAVFTLLFYNSEQMHDSLINRALRALS